MEGREWKRYEANRHQRESWKGPPYLLTKQQQNKIHNQRADGGDLKIAKHEGQKRYTRWEKRPSNHFRLRVQCPFRPESSC